MIAWESDELPAEQREQFWRRVMDLENAPVMTDFQRLADAGLELPDPGTVNDEQVTAKLWEVIHGLARIRTFLRDTDHLSDSELYEVLWRRVLREANPIIADDDDSAWHVGLLGTIGIVGTRSDRERDSVAAVRQLCALDHLVAQTGPLTIVE